MTKKILIGLGALLAVGFASSPALAAGAGASALTGLDLQSRSLIKTVAFSPRGIRRSLRDRGYRRIRFTDRNLPVYRVRACRNGKRFAIRLNRWADITRRVRIGWCDDDRFMDRPHGLSLPQIRRRLRNRGFYRIRYIDRQLPVYKAIACRGGRRFLLRINRRGNVMNRERRGWCGRRHYGPRNDYYDGPRRPRVLLHGPGFSITLGKKRR